MDIVFIEGLEVNCTIGVYDWEKEIKQKLVLDLEMAHDNHIPGATDRVDDALDYAKVSELVTLYLEKTPMELVERVAETVAEMVQGHFSVPWVRITVRKPGAVKNARAVGVRIERGRKPQPSVLSEDE